MSNDYIHTRILVRNDDSFVCFNAVTLHYASDKYT